MFEPIPAVFTSNSQVTIVCYITYVQPSIQGVNNALLLICAVFRKQLHELPIPAP
jgi:hypothetical protein